jgi:hypothetical protein
MHPRSGSLRLLCEIGAALAADPGPPVPPAPSGSGAVKLEICDVLGNFSRVSDSDSDRDIAETMNVCHYRASRPV